MVGFINSCPKTSTFDLSFAPKFLLEFQVEVEGKKFTSDKLCMYIQLRA